MGRYLASGITIEIEIYSKKGCDFDENDLPVINKHLSKYFNMDYYNLEIFKEEKVFYYKIDKEKLEENIHKCIKDFYRLTNNILSSVCGESDVDYKSKEFNQDNYPLKLEYVKSFDGKIRLEITNKDSYLNDSYSFYLPYWLYWDCSLLGYDGKYNISLNCKSIWSDHDKYDGEDETYLLYCLNKMKNSYLKNSLAKNIVFLIDG